ncbi:MAG: anti-sigma factor antagonist [Prevotella sp.]|nr:anti-sigma factor antagonist [Candidatus Prevotella equi]
MTIQLKGHLDTSIVAEVKKDIDAQLSNVDATEHIVIDCSELDYISSSGLRILIGIKKSYPNMVITEVSTDVYNVFEMTGFTRILDIRKALRKIDLSTCKLLGEGGNGAVYRINDEEIVKVSKREQSDDKLIHESEQVREAFLMGIPTVISFDTIDCGNGHKGIVMEALDSQSLGAYISEDPQRMDDIIPKYIELFRQSNAIEVNSPLFHDIKEWLRWHLTLPQRIINDEEAAVLNDLLNEVPDSNHFIHFDGHVGNVLMHGEQDDRNVMLIDFGDSGTGHPILEIAGWAFIMLEPEHGRNNVISQNITGITHEMRRKFCRKMLAEMFHITDAKELDTVVYQAELIGYLKSAYIAQRHAPYIKDEKFKNFLARVVHDAITLAPEIKVAIHSIIARLQNV